MAVVLIVIQSQESWFVLGVEREEEALQQGEGERVSVLTKWVDERWLVDVALLT